MLNAPSTRISWSSITANPKDLSVMGESMPTLADAKASAFLTSADALARCFTTWRQEEIIEYAILIAKKKTYALCCFSGNSLRISSISCQHCRCDCPANWEYD